MKEETTIFLEYFHNGLVNFDGVSCCGWAMATLNSQLFPDSRGGGLFKREGEIWGRGIKENRF